MSKVNIVFKKGSEDLGVLGGHLYNVTKKNDRVIMSGIEIGTISDDGNFVSSIDGLTGKLLKTKTLKCTGYIIDGEVSRSSFKIDKRYQVDMSRPVSGVAGVIFDEDGYPWSLMRVEVGFETMCAKFEAKYF